MLSPTKRRRAGQGRGSRPAARNQSKRSGCLTKVSRCWRRPTRSRPACAIRPICSSTRSARTGLYFQQGHGPQRLVRLELRSQADQQATTFLEVCDGHRFSSFRETSSGPSLTYVDLDRVVQAWQQASGAGGASVPPLPAAAGLPKLIDGIRKNFHFTRMAEGRLGELAVWTVEGRWKPDQLAAAVPDQKSAIEAGRQIDIKKFPAQLPERVVLDIGQSDHFPYRIRYLRRGPGATSSEASGGGAGEGGATGELAAYHLPGGYRVIVSMEMFDVRLNAPIDPRQFVYQPTGAQTFDVTDAYLKSLNLAAPAK